MILALSNPVLTDDRGNQVYQQDGRKARNERILRLTVNEIDDNVTVDEIVARFGDFGRDKLLSLAQKTASKATVQDGIRLDKSWEAVSSTGRFITLQFRAPRGLQVDDLDALIASL